MHPEDARDDADFMRRMAERQAAKMSDTPKPDAATLRALAVKHGCDPRTIVRAINGEAVRGLAGDRAKAAADEWRKSQRKRRP